MRSLYIYQKIPFLNSNNKRLSLSYPDYTKYHLSKNRQRLSFLYLTNKAWLLKYNHWPVHTLPAHYKLRINSYIWRPTTPDNPVKVPFPVPVDNNLMHCQVEVQAKKYQQYHSDCEMHVKYHDYSHL